MKKIIIIFLFLMFFPIVHAVQYNQNFTFQRNSSFMDYNDWIWMQDDAYNEYLEDYTETPKENIESTSTIDDNTVGIQYQNSIGNLTEQIGSSASLFDRKKEESLLRVNRMWDYVAILVLIVFEIIKIIYNLMIFYLILWIFFVAIPQIFLYIKDSLVNLMEKRVQRKY